MSKPSSGLGVGLSSLLATFIILCLTTFASLSAVSSSADYRLAEKTAAAVTRYYRADSSGEQALAELALALEIDGGVSPQELGWTKSTQEDNLFTRSFPLDDRQTLQVTVDISQRIPQVTRWQVENTVVWEEGNSFDLWEGPPIG